MVVSKRCKICTTIDANNIPISGEYFGKQLSDLITKISGIELDPRKLNGVVLCQQCSIMLAHTEGVVDKLRKCMQRLQKSKRVARTPRTASKETNEAGAQTTKKASKTTAANGDMFKKITDDPKSSNALTDEKKEAPIENTKRKLMFQEETGSVNSDSVSKMVKRTSECLDHTADSSYGQDTKIYNSKSENDAMESTTDQSVIKTKTKNHNCVLCGKNFDQKRKLRDHIESSHMGEKLKECPNCFMEFRSVQKYESHVFNEKCKTTLQPCQFENCNRRFKNAYRMEEHMKEKHCSAPDTQSD